MSLTAVIFQNILLLKHFQLIFVSVAFVSSQDHFSIDSITSINFDQGVQYDDKFEIIVFDDKLTLENELEPHLHSSKSKSENVFRGRTKGVRDFGDLGRPVLIENPSKDVAAAIEEGYTTYGYNKYISDLIPLQRRLPDRRNNWCFAPNRFLEALNPTSIIITFYNEALSVLLRTIYSIFDRSPSHLILEVILIDDFSDHEELGHSLEEAILKFGKVKLIRLFKREGLVRARLIGFENAIGPIITFLDSHIEVAAGWLEPLLDRVTRNENTIAVPMFNTINAKTFACNFTNEPPTSIGGFKWDLLFQFQEIMNPINAENPMEPIPTPTMSGGFFSIHRDFFEYLGRYDEQFEIWGAENLELSFKAWMCGGRLELVPCSHVAHLERLKSVYPRDKIEKNNARLALTWMDEYAKFYLNKIPPSQRDPGDISKRIELRRSLNCMPFDWYINTFYPKAFVPRDVISSGEVLNLQDVNGNVNLCLDSNVNKSPTNESPSLYWHCHGMAGNQFWYYTMIGEIRHDSMCLDYFGTDVTLWTCHNGKGNQEWEYHADTGVIVHKATELCLTLELSENKVIVDICQGKGNQKWRFQYDTIYETFKDFKYNDD